MKYIDYINTYTHNHFLGNEFPVNNITLWFKFALGIRSGNFCNFKLFSVLNSDVKWQFTVVNYKKYYKMWFEFFFSSGFENVSAIKFASIITIQVWTELHDLSNSYSTETVSKMICGYSNRWITMLKYVVWSLWTSR